MKRILLFIALICPLLATWIEVDNEPDLVSFVMSISSYDTIYVRNGEYYLTNTLNMHGGSGAHDVALIGESRDGVVIYGAGMSNSSYGDVPHCLLVGNVQRILVENMSLGDCWYHPVILQAESGCTDPILRNLRLFQAGEQFLKVTSSSPPTTYCDNGIVENCIFEFEDRARHWYTNGVDILATDNWVIRDNVFRNIRGPVGVLCGPAVLAWQNAINTTVERNIFIECDFGISMGNSAGPGTIARDGETTYDNQNAIVRNNIIYREGDGDVGITVNKARNARIYNNTVILNGTFPWNIEYRFSATNAEIYNNLTDGSIFSRDGASANLGTNLTSAELSWFVDPSEGDLHILEGCDAIDAATTSAYVTDDFDGDSRPVGSAPDIGADEFNPSVALEEYLPKPVNYELMCYPNPFNGICKIKTAGTSSIKIFDINGNLIYKADNNQNEIDFTPKQTGIYLVKANVNQSTICKRIYYIK